MAWPALAALALLAAHAAPHACAIQQGARSSKDVTAMGEMAHVVVTADKDFQKEPAMRSVLRHASGPVKIYTFLAEHETEANTPREIDGRPVEIVRFTRKDIKPYVNLAYKSQKTDYGDPKSPHHYVRYIMADKLPNVNKVLYLDADTITTLDVSKFLREHLRDGQVAAGFPRLHRNWYEPQLGRMRAKGFNFATQNATVNTGVLAVNLAKWREGGWARSVQQVVAANNKYKWWTNTLQPPLHLILGGRFFEHLPADRLVDEMGMVKGGPVADPPGGRFYHWQGPRKAWTYAGFSKKLYGKYTLDKFANVSSDGSPL